MAEYDLRSPGSLFAELKDLVVPTKEPTLFAVGGRGYYENPASDLLAFFLKPDAEHGFRDLFLVTYFECMEADYSQLDLNHFAVQREVRTIDGNLIDIQIIGSDWCLLIENKIRHAELNPFVSYEEHANKICKPTKLFSVLSPSGNVKKEGKNEDWKGVSYHSYCKALRLKLPEFDSPEPRSKWRLFAREFVLHLENELYNPTMTPEQADFLERHAAEARKIQTLFEQYPVFLSTEVKTRMENALGYEVEVVDHKWAIRIFCHARWGGDSLAIRPPTQEPKGLFLLTIYTSRLTTTSLTEAERPLLEGYFHEPKHNAWTSHEGFQSREQALTALIERVSLVETPARNT